MNEGAFRQNFGKSFNQNIGKWNLDNVNYCDSILDDTIAFQIKYNNNKSIPYKTKEIKEWFKENRDRMNEIDLKVEYGEIIDVFFLNINSKKNINLNN